ncbi:MAG: hypothetical protein WCF84_14110 [Anaerolineae bacterium]
MTSITAGLYGKVRSNPIAQQLVPLEAAISFPVPLVQGNFKFLRFLLYGYKRVQQGKPSLIRMPFAQLAVTFPDGKFAEYVDYRLAPPVTGMTAGEFIGEYPHPAIRQSSFDELERKRDELFQAYDRVIALCPRFDLTQDEQKTVGQFRRLLSELAEPSLEPFYHALNPRFFQWLEQATHALIDVAEKKRKS